MPGSPAGTPARTIAHTSYVLKNCRRQRGQPPSGPSRQVSETAGSPSPPPFPSSLPHFPSSLPHFPSSLPHFPSSLPHFPSSLPLLPSPPPFPTSPPPFPSSPSSLPLLPLLPSPLPLLPSPPPFPSSLPLLPSVLALKFRRTHVVQHTNQENACISKQKHRMKRTNQLQTARREGNVTLVFSIASIAPEPHAK